MNLKQFSILIEKYKKGECSAREKELLENYLESFQNSTSEWNEKEMGDQRKIEEKIFSGIMKNIENDKDRYFARAFQSPLLLKMAASIIFFIVLATGVLYISGVFNQKIGAVVWYEKITSPGEKSTITLSDGSKFTLNAGSILKYPRQFNGKTRDIYLKGEAYFEVRHNSKQPFVVHTGNLTTTDLGTKFDVSAYPDNKTISVSLLEGKVKVSMSEKGRIDKVTVLKPKEQLLYDKGNNVIKFGKFDSIEAVGWKDNIYKFENEPLSKVMQQLGRAYGIKFKLADQSILAQKITVKFEKNSLQTVVNVIKNLTGLDYKIVKGNKDTKEVLFFR